MNTKRMMTVVMVVAALAMLLAASSAGAGQTVGEGESSGEINLAGTVLSKINYQGRLSDAEGNPLDGNYNLVFQFWDAATAGSQLGIDIVKWGLPVRNGLFTAELDVPQDIFTGRAVWLQISIEAQVLTPRQELLPVPYALSLRPGGTISSPGPTALNAVNESGGYGLQGQSQDNIGLLGISGSGSYTPSGRHGVHGKGEGVGLYGEGGHTGVYGEGTNDGVKGESTNGNGVRGVSTNGDGVRGESTAADKSGVHGHSTNGVGVRGRSDAGAGVVGWTGASDDSGVFGNSETGIGVTGRSDGNNGVVGVTTSSNAGHAGVWARNEGAGVAIFSEGDLHVTGAFRGDLGGIGGAPFPRPAYTSGWVAVPRGFTTLVHGLGGNVDSYAVDMWCKDDNPSVGIKGAGYTGDAEGAAWVNLTNSSVTVRRYGSDDYCDSVRVRIWVYR
jgi:hypothetical protein